MVVPTCFGFILPSSESVPVPSERCSIEEQSIEYIVDGHVVSNDVVVLPSVGSITY
jgi:hypothetical protein